MIVKKRISYFAIIISVIFLGLLSRKIDGTPTYIGDILYAVMVYFGIRFLFRSLSTTKSMLLALFLCYCIELQQLYRANWIVTLRHTTFGHYVLGQGFLWSDLVFYTIGVAIACFSECFVFKTRKSTK